MFSVGSFIVARSTLDDVLPEEAGPILSGVRIPDRLVGGEYQTHDTHRRYGP